jgi:glycosyltransferase involved in cell wall biosynthesis
MDLVLSPLMGRALTEAALAERPIVAYDIDCHPEIVKNDQSGFLVPYLDYRAMALAGDHLLDNPAVAKKMGQEARAVALDLMDPVKLIREQRLVFRELLANGN